MFIIQATVSYITIVRYAPNCGITYWRR